jgi:tripartite-type tricarboxylate transporter receptor subunit TctC
LTDSVFRLNACIQMTHVPYKGSAPALTDLIGGRLDLVLDVPTSVMPHIQSGRLRALAVMSDKRFGFLPDVPSIAEAGYPNAAAIAWTGVAVPAGTPAPIVSKLSAAIRGARPDPSITSQSRTAWVRGKWCFSASRKPAAPSAQTR